MADILKISTPLVERLPTQAVRPSADAAIPFDLSDVTRVLQTTDPSELLQQNTAFLPKENETPKILADLLKDPAVTATMIRNISMLQEVVHLLPGTNTALTQEIEQLFNALLIAPQDIVPELTRQAESTTLFKGELFNQLRSLLQQATATSTGTASTSSASVAESFLSSLPFVSSSSSSAAQPQAPNPELATSIGVLLKGINATFARQDVLNSVANNLTYLANNLSASPRLFEQLTDLTKALRAPDAQQNFHLLKEQVTDVLRAVEKSILFTPQMEKIVPLVAYNLSRYNDNDDFLPDALRLLLSNMNGDAQKAELVEKLQAYIDKFLPQSSVHSARGAEEPSQVIDVLAKIIGTQAQSEELQLVSGDKFEKIVHSLLSSPSNFTPLLHFIVPVEYMDMKAFAEIWIDPNAEDETGKRSSSNTAENTHMLMVFDVEGVGRFEAELYVIKKRIALNLLCPAAYLTELKDIGPAIRQAVSQLGYSFDTINIDRLDHTHSLMEVFTDLPHKRMGMDVKI